MCGSFLCICLLRCEGEFYSHCLPKVRDTQWMPNVCLFNEWMKTENNEKHPESCIWWGTNIGSNTKWRWRFAGAADSHSGGRDRLLWQKVSLSTAPTTSSNPETLARKYMTSLQKLQGHVSFFQSVSHRILSVIAPCPQVTPESHLSDSLSYSPCPTLCPGMWGVFFISCFHILRLLPTSLHCWVASP